MAKDPNYDRYAGMVSLPGADGKLPRPFRVDEDGNVIYRDQEPGAARPMGEDSPRSRARTGILDWAELDHRAATKVESGGGSSPRVQADVGLEVSGARSSANTDASQGNVVSPRRRINGIHYDVIGARTFDPSRSSGVSSAPNEDMMWAADANKRDAAVPYGTGERGAFLTRVPSPLPWSDRLKMGRTKPGEEEADWNIPTQDYYFSVPLINPKTGSTEFADTLNFGPRKNYPKGTAVLSHGHIDDGPLDSRGQKAGSDGMVDYVDRRNKESYGDSSSSVVERPLPLATISQGRIGWHFIENGQLKFMYPSNSVDGDQKKKIWDNLDSAQLRYQNKSE